MHCNINRPTSIEDLKKSYRPSAKSESVLKRDGRTIARITKSLDARDVFNAPMYMYVSTVQIGADVRRSIYHSFSVC